jgi:metal-responsive CopG/Arc/MetJ family transcriptional regulator
MKGHISAVIDTDLLSQLDRFRREEQRSRSQALEMAIGCLLRDRANSANDIVSSKGHFKGSFVRGDAYER